MHVVVLSKMDTVYIIGLIPKLGPYHLGPDKELDYICGHQGGCWEVEIKRTATSSRGEIRGEKKMRGDVRG